MIFEVFTAAVAVSSLLLSFILLRVSGYSVIQSGKNLWKRASEAHAKKKRERPAKPKKQKKTRQAKKSEENPSMTSQPSGSDDPGGNPEERGNT